MNILVINCGSSSIKFQLIAMENRGVVAKGLVERIGIAGSTLQLTAHGEKILVERPVRDHAEGVELIVAHLTDPEKGVIQDRREIAGIGHRVVHGGERFKSTVPIDEPVLDALRDCIPLAPLHNPPNIVGIEACARVLPGIPQAGVFDTAFHQTMPRQAYMYPIPLSFYQKHRIRRYGFHGTSHLFVAKATAAYLRKPIGDLRIITCHLGNGSSVAAIRGGRSVDTTMGFTPLAGLMMGTRCGDIDPAIPLFLQKVEGLSAQEVDAVLNKKSGLQGISEISSDMRDIEARAAEGDAQAQLAIEMLVHRIRKAIGAYMAVLNGADAVVFTAGIGENDRMVRRLTCQNMDALGLCLDEEANERRAEGVLDIGRPEGKVRLLVVPTNEELEIAEQTAEVLGLNARV